jgi:hypothetical protein
MRSSWGVGRVVGVFGRKCLEACDENEGGEGCVTTFREEILPCFFLRVFDCWVPWIFESHWLVHVRCAGSPAESTGESLRYLLEFV